MRALFGLLGAGLLLGRSAGPVLAFGAGCLVVGFLGLVQGGRLNSYGLERLREEASTSYDRRSARWKTRQEIRGVDRAAWVQHRIDRALLQGQTLKTDGRFILWVGGISLAGGALYWAIGLN